MLSALVEMGWGSWAAKAFSPSQKRRKEKLLNSNGQYAKRFGWKNRTMPKLIIKNKSFKIFLNSQVSGCDKPTPLKRDLDESRRSLKTLPSSPLLVPKWHLLPCGGSIEPCTFLWSCSS
jgi:hypothetical protein